MTRRVKAQDAKPRGRPSEYDAAYCERVVELGREGCSKAEMAAELGCTRSTMDNWAKANPEFSDAVQHAQELSLAWWEKQARTNLATQGFQSSLWSKAMSGRFPAEPYRERQEVSGANGGALQFVVETGVPREEG